VLCALLVSVAVASYSGRRPWGLCTEIVGISYISPTVEESSINCVVVVMMTVAVVIVRPASLPTIAVSVVLDYSLVDPSAADQAGGRFSMKAWTPSSALGSIMLQAIVDPASA
jgi:hypothetical protein